MVSKIKQSIKKSIIVRRIYFEIFKKMPVLIWGEEKRIKQLCKKRCGYDPNLITPSRLNEKMNWIKLHDHRDFCTMVADKCRVREYLIDNFGEEFVVPIVQKFESWKDVTIETIPEYPCIIKCNSGSGTWKIIRNKNDIDIKKLRKECKLWMNTNYYYDCLEWQYKNIKPCLLIEKLLLDKNGCLPEDIKLHYFNGKLEFIYCVVDREGKNYRVFFSPEWEQLPFQYTGKKKYKDIHDRIEKEPPKNLDKMIAFGNEIAKNFEYVRVDYYEIEDRMYFSEITLFHGGGFNNFYPEEYEKVYADKLQIEG